MLDNVLVDEPVTGLVRIVNEKDKFEIKDILLEDFNDLKNQEVKSRFRTYLDTIFDSEGLSFVYDSETRKLSKIYIEDEGEDDITESFLETYCQYRAVDYEIRKCIDNIETSNRKISKQKENIENSLIRKKELVEKIDLEENEIELKKLNDRLNKTENGMRRFDIIKFKAEKTLENQTDLLSELRKNLEINKMGVLYSPCRDSDLRFGVSYSLEPKRRRLKLENRIGEENLTEEFGVIRKVLDNLRRIPRKTLLNGVLVLATAGLVSLSGFVEYKGFQREQIQIETEKRQNQRILELAREDKPDDLSFRTLISKEINVGEIEKEHLVLNGEDIYKINFSNFRNIPMYFLKKHFLDNVPDIEIKLVSCYGIDLKYTSTDVIINLQNNGEIVSEMISHRDLFISEENNQDCFNKELKIAKKRLESELGFPINSILNMVDIQNRQISPNEFTGDYVLAEIIPDNRNFYLQNKEIKRFRARFLRKDKKGGIDTIGYDHTLLFTKEGFDRIKPHVTVNYSTCSNSDLVIVHQDLIINPDLVKGYIVINNRERLKKANLPVCQK